MDLDFSFALVSSLTPRSQSKKTHLVENNDCSSKLLKTKQKLGYSSKSKSTTSTSKKIKLEKENKPPKEQLKNRSGSFKPSKVLEKKSFQQDLSNGDDSSPQVPFDLVNIAIRKNRVKDKRKQKPSLQQSRHNLLNVSNDKIQLEKPTHQNNTDLSSEKLTLDNFKSRSSCSLEVSCFCGKSCDNCLNQQVKRKSSVLSKYSFSSRCSTDLIDSSIIKEESNSNFKKLANTPCKLKRRRHSSRKSGLFDSTLSTAYDSDSITKTCRNKVKVIQETPETDKSFVADVESKSVSSGVVLEIPETDQSLNSTLKKKNKQLNNYDTTFQKEKKTSKLKSSSTCDIEVNKLVGNDHVDLHEEINMTSCNNSAMTSKMSKKKLRSNGEYTLTNMFKVESSIKNQTSYMNQNDLSGPIKKPSSDPKEKRNLSTSQILKEINTRDSVCKKSKSPDIKSICKKKSDKKSKINVLEAENILKPIKVIKKSTKRNSQSSLTRLNVSNSLMLPTEVIRKSDHVRNWLKSTEEKSIISISSESSFSSPATADIELVKVQKPPSLSPRIKKKMKIATSTLNEEQQLFEDLYGLEMIERLSGDLDEDAISCQESVECTEKVLNKLYGTVWQTSHNIPQSEPAKGRKKSKGTKKKDPLTERKKRRTSIYDVFSSSSSEDRFEEFLESVQRGKLQPKRRSNLPGTPDFIKDSDSDSNCSLAFYQNIVSSAVKEDIKNLRLENESSVTSFKTNRGRRLSFSSSKYELHSDNGNSEIETLKKQLKPLPKEKKKVGRKPKSKEKVREEVDDKIDNDLSLFTLVTPFKVRDKISDEKLNKRLYNTNESVTKLKVPKNVGKSKTPNKPVQVDDKANTEENLRKKYLIEGDFKCPTTVKSFKTPTKPITRNVPCSPALSFLSSLSEITGNLPCHPDAVVFKKNFKSKREELAKKLFNLYNKEVFENKLPEDLLIEWNTRMTSTSGFCYNKRTYINNQMTRSSRIVLSTKILDRPVRLRDTLIHELCHAATWIVDGTSDGHGSKWKAWAEKSHRRFPELPVIKRCHDYAISTKYTYKCMSCGYCIGRHTKSLNVERKRCGYCFGTFQVFVTTKMSRPTGTGSGQSSTNTRPQRNPTGFALFVKENYGAIKREYNVPHAQVMQLLSKEFAKAKISKLNFEKCGETQ